MTYPTFKEHLTLLEARKDSAKYTEKQVKGAIDKVTAKLSGTESASMTKLARRYARLDASIKKMKEEHDALNTRLKGDIQDYFNAEDVVLTRVVETAQFTLTMAKEVTKGEGTKSVDYEKVIAALSALIPDELQSRVEMITEKYTTIVPPKAPIKRLTVSKEVNEEILEEGIIERAKAFFKSIMSWANRFDGKLEKIKRMAGMVNEGKTIAYYDEKSRQRNANSQTIANIVRKLSASTLPQGVVDAIRANGKDYSGELTKADLKELLKKAKVQGMDADEVFDVLGI